MDKCCPGTPKEGAILTNGSKRGIMKKTTNEGEFSMNQPYAVWEVVLYNFLDSFPYMMLGMLTFRNHRRFSLKASIILLALMEVAFETVATYSLVTRAIPMTLVDIILSLLMVGFTVLAFRDHPGKLIFAVLVLLNLGNLVVVCGKCLEGQLFPKYALQVYRYTFALCKLPLQAILLPLAYRLIFRNICRDDEEEDAFPTQQASQHWKYLWLVPGVFYLIWMHHFYNSNRTVLENMLDPASAGYLLLIDAGSILIYRLIVQLADAYRSNISLQEKNQALTVQTMQYESLTKRINDERQARHDLRHHLALLRTIRDSGDWTALDEYLDQYAKTNALDTPPGIYCENELANTLLAYFCALAREQGVEYEVQAALPETLSVGKIDLSAIFGNLLENALEACGRQKSGRRYIRVRCGIYENKLLLTIENSCEGVPHIHHSGVYYSSKRDSLGIGIESVRTVVAHYNGVCQFDARDNTFTAKVMLYI